MRRRITPPSRARCACNLAFKAPRLFAFGSIACRVAPKCQSLGSPKAWPLALVSGRMQVVWVQPIHRGYLGGMTTRDTGFGGAKKVKV